MIKKLVICLLLFISFEGISATNEALITLNGTNGDSITLSQFEMDAFSILVKELGDRSLNIRLSNDYDISSNKIPMIINGIEYQYVVEDKIATISYKKEVVGVLDIPRIINVFDNADENNQAKCPACAIGAGIVISQGLCALSAGGEHAYCGSTCACGVSSVSTTCFLGFRSTNCTCQPCPDPDSGGSVIPTSLYPGINGWLTGIPYFIDGHGGRHPDFPEEEQ